MAKTRKVSGRKIRRTKSRRAHRGGEFTFPKKKELTANNFNNENEEEPQGTARTFIVPPVKKNIRSPVTEITSGTNMRPNILSRGPFKSAYQQAKQAASLPPAPKPNMFTRIKNTITPNAERRKGFKKLTNKVRSKLPSAPTAGNVYQGLSALFSS